jgi:SAM-dependent methyltransferase
VTSGRDDVERLLVENRFGYQRVELGQGLETRGHDRRETAEAVLPAGLAGRSVLDVGCAIGYFCFEAERRGAARVVGTELKPKRLRAALELKESFGSAVEFSDRDVLRDSSPERFDLVLALNVIHHLRDPFAALERLSALTSWRLALEFPTFADPRYQRANAAGEPKPWDLYDREPLVGVSTRGAKSTFVFAPPAIERALMELDPEPAFESVRFLPSPVGGRAIAICEKRETSPGA